MRHHVGCVIFVSLGLAWLGYFMVDFFATNVGDCAFPDDACSFYRGYVSGYVWWRGIAVALLLILAYLGFRRLTKDDDVQ